MCPPNFSSSFWNNWKVKIVSMRTSVVPGFNLSSFNTSKSFLVVWCCLIFLSALTRISIASVIFLDGPSCKFSFLISLLPVQFDENIGGEASFGGLDIPSYSLELPSASFIPVVPKFKLSKSCGFPAFSEFLSALDRNSLRY